MLGQKCHHKIVGLYDKLVKQVKDLDHLLEKHSVLSEEHLSSDLTRQAKFQTEWGDMPAKVSITEFDNIDCLVVNIAIQSPDDGCIWSFVSIIGHERYITIDRDSFNAGKDFDYVGQILACDLDVLGQYLWALKLLGDE